MVTVAGEDYAIEKKLIKKLDFFAKMVSRENQKQDVVLITHGKTGEGKTNTSLVMGYYFKLKLKRDIHLYFTSTSATNFAKNNKEKIIILDEPSLDSLSTDQLSRRNKDFMRLLHTMRSRRHILIVNLTRFWRFPEDLVVERALGFINMHSRGGSTPGRFQYIRQKNLERLWNEYQTKHKRSYGKLKAFGGHMPELMERIMSDGKSAFEHMDLYVEEVPHATLDDYNRLKDRSVSSIGEVDKKLTKKELMDRRKLIELRKRIAILIRQMGLTFENEAPKLGTTTKNLYLWEKASLDDPLMLEN